jgi:hypothetical protein
MGRQVERDSVAALAPSTPWLACHQPHMGGRRCGGGRSTVSRLILLTALRPPLVGRGSHPHHYKWVGRRNMAG